MSKSKLIIFNDEDHYHKYCEEHEERIILVYEDDVYDVTDFLEEHPGGPDIIEEYRTNDITELFHSSYPHAHSKRALLTLYKYKIGFFKDEHDEEVHKNFEENFVYPRVVDKRVEYKEFKIDLSKGVGDQVAGFNKKQYLHMLQNPVEFPPFQVSNNSFFETLINPKFLHTFLFWVIFFLYTNWSKKANLSNKDTEESISFLAILGAFGLGVITWTLIEYTLYKVFFSAEEHLLENKWAIWLHFILYGKHKIAPSDKSKVGTPLLFSTLLLLGFYTIFINIFSAQFGTITFWSLILAFLTYEYIHSQLHTDSQCPQFLLDLQKQHLNFHSKKGRRGYGVITRLWDKIFGTVTE